MKKILFILMAFFGLFSSQAQQAKSIHSFKVKALDGKTIDFSKFKGKKILIVNTASECGFTPQYEGLQKLYETYKDQLVIVGFPANNFGGQEPKRLGCSVLYSSRYRAICHNPDQDGSNLQCLRFSESR